SHCRFATTTERKAIDGCYHRLAEILDEIEDLLSVRAGLFRFYCRDMRELADVGSRDERFIPSSRQDDAAHLRIIPCVLKGCSKVFPGSLIESVEHLRTIQRHVGNGALFLVQKILQH